MLEKILMKIRQLNYRLKRDYLTMNNVVIAVAFFVALSWAWGSIQSMQQNYELQRMVHTKRQQAEIAKLQVALLEYDAKYYESSEYLDLTVRKRLGLVNPGDRQLIVPSTDSLTEEATPTSNQPSIQANSQSNFQQWTQFLLGNNTN